MFNSWFCWVQAQLRSQNPCIDLFWVGPCETHPILGAIFGSVFNQTQDTRLTLAYLTPSVSEDEREKGEL